MKKIKLGISSCLLGKKVRYNGTHKLEPYLKFRLGKYIEWLPVCPELEAGLPVPREAMNLCGQLKSPGLLGVKSQRDYTPLIKEFIHQKIAQLKNEGLWGFVFKSKSPSCGLTGVQIYNGPLASYAKTEGLFAKAFRQHFPFLPLTDEKRLNNILARENFILCLAVLVHWQKALSAKKPAQALALFHRQHKLILIACDRKTWQVLNQLQRRTQSKDITQVYQAYQQKMLEALQKGFATPSHLHVLSFISKYLKRFLQPYERQRLTKAIHLYAQGNASLKDLSQIIKAYAQKYQQPWLLEQNYLKIPTQEWTYAWNRA